LQTKSQRLGDQNPELRNDLVEYLHGELHMVRSSGVDHDNGDTTTETTTAAMNKNNNNDANDKDAETGVGDGITTTSPTTTVSNVDELTQLDRELEDARETVTKLESKQAFVGRRLESYERALATASSRNAANSSIGSNDDNNSDIQLQKLQAYHQQLEPVRNSHAQMMQTLHLLRQRIATLERRRQELQTQTDECQVVLETLQRQQELEIREDENDGEVLEEQVAVSPSDQTSSSGGNEEADEEIGRVVVSQQTEVVEETTATRLRLDKEASPSLATTRKDDDGNVASEALSSGELELSCTITTTVNTGAGASSTSTATTTTTTTSDPN